MYWRVKNSPTTHFRFLVGNDVPYSSQDFLELSPDSLPINEAVLNYELDDDGGNRNFSDFIPSEYGGMLIARPSIMEVFRGFFPGINCKLYNARLCAEKILIFCCLTEIEGFDFQKSKFESFDDGDIYRVFDLKLIDEFVVPYDIFRLADNWGPRFELIVSDRFVDVYHSHNLTGLEFLPT